MSRKNIELHKTDRLRGYVDKETQSITKIRQLVDILILFYILTDKSLINNYITIGSVNFFY